MSRSTLPAWRFPPRALRLALTALPLAWLWFVLINHLRIEWSVNPQYTYGWAAPSSASISSGSAFARRGLRVED